MEIKVSQTLSSTLIQPTGETSELTNQELKDLLAEKDMFISILLGEVKKLKEEISHLKQPNHTNATTPTGWHPDTTHTDDGSQGTDTDNSRLIDKLKEKIRSLAHEDGNGPMKIIQPYVAAYLAGKVEKMNHRKFNETFGTNISKSSFSNWTKYYFNRMFDSKQKIDPRFLYNPTDLKYFWRWLGLSENDIEKLLLTLPDYNQLD